DDLVRDAPDHQQVGTHGAGLDNPAIQCADGDLASVDCGDHLVAYRLGEPAESLGPVPLADDVIGDDPEPGVPIDLLAVSRRSAGGVDHPVAARLDDDVINLVDDQVLEVRVIEHGDHGHRDVARGGRAVADLVDRDQAEAVLLAWSEPGQHDGVGAAPKGGHSSDGAGQAQLMNLAVRKVSRPPLAVLVLAVPGDGDGAHLGRDHRVRGDRGRSLVPHNLDLTERGPSAGDSIPGDRPDLNLPGGADPDATVVDDRVRGR